MARILTEVEAEIIEKLEKMEKTLNDINIKTDKAMNMMRKFAEKLLD